MLVKDVNLKIKQELVIPVDHYLMAKSKVPKISKITEIISYPAVIDQCKNYSGRIFRKRR